MDIRQIKLKLKDGQITHCIIEVHNDLIQKQQCQKFLLKNNFEWGIANKKDEIDTSTRSIYNYILYYKNYQYYFIYSTSPKYTSTMFSQDNPNYYFTEFKELSKSENFPIKDVINLFNNIL